MYKKIAVLLLISLSFVTAAEQKVVFDLTSADAAKIEKHLINNVQSMAKYYESEGIAYKFSVVISGNAYQYFVADIAKSPYKTQKKLYTLQKKLASLFEKLHKRYKVEFDMCNAGRKARGISKDVLYPFVKSEVNKSIYLVRWQNMGYAYLPIH